MEPDRWRRITGIFHATLEQPSDRRAAFLADACADDPTLRVEVEALLAGDEAALQQGDPLRPPQKAIAVGTMLGPYRIESLLGAGGMGEVYKARDTRLNRTIAVKVLPTSFAHDVQLRQRFEREAQAIAALHHPHICVLHDIGKQDGIEFLVLEYLEGETIEHRLKSGPMPLDRVLQHAIEIADALQVAHRTGLVHRDLKPGNVMLTKGGAKLLDFGLAKFGAAVNSMTRATAQPTTPRTLTAEGAIVGTFQYMAPEQLEGKEADSRTDLFAFGTLVYEMVTGRRAFTGEGRSSLIASILRDDPPPLSAAQTLAPPALELVVRTCLAKDPDHRLQSAHDVALQLRWIRDGVLQTTSAPVPASRGTNLRWAGALMFVALAAAAAGGFVAYRQAQRAIESRAAPSFKQITFRRGAIDAARFTPDGQTVVYTAAWDGNPNKVYSARVDTAESTPLPLPPDVTVLSISRAGELALLTKIQAGAGTLARVPVGGGGVREVSDRIVSADWSPDGRTLAVLRFEPGATVLEYPAGTELHRFTDRNPVQVRVSPDGDLLAVLDPPGAGSGSLTIFDRTGRQTQQTRRWPGITYGVSWSPSGDEVWFGASEVGLNFGIHAVSRDGKERVVENSAGSLRLMDIGADGRVLLVQDRGGAGMVALAPGESQERDLSWLDFGRPFSLSADGRLLAFTESGAGAGALPAAYIRTTDGAPAVRLAEGTAMALSPDGKSSLFWAERGKRLAILPIGVGEARTLDTGALTRFAPFGAWTPDGTRVVFTAQEPGHQRRLFVQSIAGGAPRPVSPEGTRWSRGTGSMVVSSDSRYVLAIDAEQRYMRYPLDGGPALPVAGVTPEDTPLGWSDDERSIWVETNDARHFRIAKLDVVSGRRTPWREVAYADPAGLDPGWLKVLISADGKSYVYGYARTMSDLYVASAVR